MKQIDAKGLSCPAPVLETKVAVDESHPRMIQVQVDNEPAQQNVARFLQSQGYRTEVDRQGEIFTIVGTNEGAAEDEARQPAPMDTDDTEQTTKIVVMVTTDRLGSGDDELGGKLMINFIKTLKEMGPNLWQLLLLNGGVKLAIEGATTLADLMDLAESGVTILVCGTCLDHFGLLDQKEVGETTNMLDVVTALEVADKVISI